MWEPFPSMSGGMLRIKGMSNTLCWIAFYLKWMLYLWYWMNLSGIEENFDMKVIFWEKKKLLYWNWMNNEGISTVFIIQFTFATGYKAGTIAVLINIKKYSFGNQSTF